MENAKDGVNWDLRRKTLLNPVMFTLFMKMKNNGRRLLPNNQKRD